MLQQIGIKNFTVFAEANLRFGKKLNVFVGENGLGKTHLLKLAYSALSVSSEEGRRSPDSIPTKSALEGRLASKLLNVFRPDSLGRLARRKRGRERCEIDLSFEQRSQDISFSFATQSTSSVVIEKLPEEWARAVPAYFPTRELLSIFPNFVSTYDNYHIEFDETWRDTCLLLGAPLRKGAKGDKINRLLEPLRDALGGAISLDKRGRFYLQTKDGRMEIPLVAEGLRKFGMLSQLVATGVILDKGYLFWDEPEANLNPRLQKEIAKSILLLGECGVQTFVATHSLFLLREMEILLAQQKKIDEQIMFFGLHQSDDGVKVRFGHRIDDIGDIASLDEELQQTDRFLAEAAE